MLKAIVTNLGQPHGIVDNLKRVAIEQENMLKALEERLLMAITSCVHGSCCINIVSDCSVSHSNSDITGAA